MRIFDRTISSLVDENFIYARALHFLGIEFYELPHRKLGEICHERGLDKDKVIQTFYLFDQSKRFSFNELRNYPLEMIIEYLKHTHYLFIKEKLPYIVQLINQYEAENDLKLVFPHFVDEFIEHIYEEEDVLFSYIYLLIDFEKNPSGKVIHHLRTSPSISLQVLHKNHQEEEEMVGIRLLIEERKDDSILWHVIVKEIKAFDRELWYHSEIENNILFPKAISLENKLKPIIQHLSSLN